MFHPIFMSDLCRFFFFQAEDGIRDRNVTGVQTCALPISQLDVYMIDIQIVHKVYSRPFELPGISLLKHQPLLYRSEERRVGKECRFRWSPYSSKKIVECNR